MPGTSANHAQARRQLPVRVVTLFGLASRHACCSFAGLHGLQGPDAGRTLPKRNRSARTAWAFPVGRRGRKSLPPYRKTLCTLNGPRLEDFKLLHCGARDSRGRITLFIGRPQTDHFAERWWLLDAFESQSRTRHSRAPTPPDVVSCKRVPRAPRPKVGARHCEGYVCDFDFTASASSEESDSQPLARRRVHLACDLRVRFSATYDGSTSGPAWGSF